MPRTLDSQLHAEMVSGSVNPFSLLAINNEAYIKGYIRYSPTDTNTSFEISVIAYQYDGLSLSITTSDRPEDADYYYMALKRGVTIAGTPHYLETSNLSITQTISHPNGTFTYKAELFPRKRLTVTGDQSYRNVITDICAVLGYTASFKSPAESFWDYQFLPDGRILTVNSGRAFLTLLKQKYFIGACDNGAGDILFFCAEEWSAIEITANALANNMESSDQNYLGEGVYSVLWRDESNTIHKHEPPTAYFYFDEAPIHNLGFLPSTALPPNGLRQYAFPELRKCGYKPTDFSVTIPINLWLQNGDRARIITDSGSAAGCILIKEYLDTTKSPAWGCVVQNFQYITNTEGGVLPSTIEAAAPYTPLNTSYFDRFLDGTVNNLQAFADWVNDYAASETLVNSLITTAKSSLYPIGSIYTSVVSTNPATLLGFGTWSAFGTGKTLVGIDPAQTEFDTVEETGGAKTHTLSSGEMPSHTHTQNSHNHTQDAHTHTQNSHNHTQDAHTHTQNSHNHTQDAHTHTQDSHNHTQNPHEHTALQGTGNSSLQQQTGGTNNGYVFNPAGTNNGTTAMNTNDATATNQAATATNQNTTATNQAATATNQNTTATNQAATATNQNTTPTNQPATATNQNTGGGSPHNNLQPYIVVYMWKRTA